MDFISRWIADLIFFIGHQTQIFWENLSLLNFSWQQIVIDILLVSVIFYYLFILIKGSRAVNILLGLVVVALIFVLSRALQLVTLGWFLDRFLTVILVAIPVIFQQELRMALERVGHTKLFLNQKAREIDKIILQIVEACETMTKAKQGALIVIQNTIPLKEFADTGVALNAKVSEEILLSIFNPASPLHDGAVIIHDNIISAAACILPHSLRNNLPVMGTRHKAALGLSENTDAGVIIVSEEKGHVSFARAGALERNVSSVRLNELLIEILNPEKYKRLQKRHQGKK